MRNSQNIFGNHHFRGGGNIEMSGLQMLTVVLSVISIIAAILIIANFGMLTAKIAIGIVSLLSSVFPVLLIIVFFIGLIIKIKWNMYRGLW